MSLLILLSLAFIVFALPVVVVALAFSGFTFAFLTSAALFIPSLSIVGVVGIVAGAERFPAAAGRIRR